MYLFEQINKLKKKQQQQKKTTKKTTTKNSYLTETRV